MNLSSEYLRGWAKNDCMIALIFSLPQRTCMVTVVGGDSKAHSDMLAYVNEQYVQFTLS